MAAISHPGEADGAIETDDASREFAWVAEDRVWVPCSPRPFEIASGLDSRLWVWNPATKHWVLNEAIGPAADPEPVNGDGPVILRVHYESFEDEQL